MKLISEITLTLALGVAAAGCSGGGGGGGGGLPFSPSGGSTPSNTPSVPTAPSAPTPSGGGSTSGGGGGFSAGVAAVESSSGSESAPVASYTALAPSKAFALATVPEDFAFATLRTVAFTVSAVDVHRKPVGRVTLTVTADGARVFKGRTDAKGALGGQFQVSSAAQEVTFELATIGIPNTKTLAPADQLAVAFGPEAN